MSLVTSQAAPETMTEGGRATFAAFAAFDDGHDPADPVDQAGMYRTHRIAAADEDACTDVVAA